ncbi:MAG: alpha/beta fold hydrolase [Phycisphaeraceae bacterium]|nr:alpha/beta fold hydrolase [Phycisphaeraceae bacterium]
MYGLIILFLVAAGLIWLAGSVALVWRLRHPHRKTAGVAVARGLATAPEELGYAADAVTFTLDDGTEVEGWIIQGEAADGPLLVVSHGFNDSRYGALTWLDRLAKHASHVVIFDHRGHGDSDAPVSAHGPKESADLAVVTRQALDRAGERRVVLFGYSFGAGVALEAAVESEMDVAGVIGDGLYRWPLEAPAGYLRSRGWPALPFTAAVGAWCRLTGGPVYDRAEQASRLAAPLLLLHGDEDRICPIDSARAVVEAAPVGRLEVFRGGRHLNLGCDFQAQYDAALSRFFDSVAAEADSA